MVVRQSRSRRGTGRVVALSGTLPAGVRKHDTLDVELSLPDGSKCPSLKGGFLVECDLINYDSTKRLLPNSAGPDRTLSGSIMAKAEGPVLTAADGKPHTAD